MRHEGLLCIFFLIIISICIGLFMERQPDGMKSLAIKNFTIRSKQIMRDSGQAFSDPCVE